MSSLQAPMWAFIAGALDGAGDTHLPDGVHVRALPSARLGMPATPLEVMRAVVSARELAQIARLNEVTWIDSQGKVLQVPFDVTPGNPVTGYFPEGDQAVWAQLEARQASTPVVVPPIIRPVPGPVIGPVVNPVIRPVTRPVVSIVEPVAQPLAQPTAPAERGGVLVRTRTAPLRFEALADSVNGPATIQADDTAPWTLAHWPVPRVRVSGSGTVGAIRWVEARRMQRRDFRIWEVWSLPVDPAPRYRPTATAMAAAVDRVQRAAVRRQPLHVAWQATGAAAAPPAGPADALQRLAQVRPELNRWLKRLLNDLSVPTWSLQDTPDLAPPSPGAPAGKMALDIEKFLLIGSIDPDAGHYLGLGSVDRLPAEEAGSLVLYRIRGLFRFNEPAWSPAEMGALGPAVRANRAAAVAGFPALNDYGCAPLESGPFLDLFQYAIAVAGQPSQGMSVPQLQAPDERGWLADPPPAVRRAVRVIGAGFGAPALAAVAAHDQYGERTLHAFPQGRRMKFGSGAVPPGLPLPWVVSQPADPAQAGLGLFEDRAAPASSVTYRIARGDWFGRWSDWAQRTAPPPDRPPPVRPAIMADVSPPQFAAPPVAPPEGLLSGMVTLTIPVPGPEELPAGGAPLARFELVETFGVNLGASITYDLAALPPGGHASLVEDPHSLPGKPQLLLRLQRTGPALPPAGQVKVSYTGRWHDTLDAVSLDAFPAVKTVVDPRPPAAPQVEHPLAYTSRPDSMGHARAEFAFIGVNGVGYRVYASNETTLLAALRKTNTALADDIAGLPMINDRAAALVDHKVLFGWDHFELVTPQALLADPATHQVRFTHRVSASLGVALFYRVVAEGPHGGLSELSASSMFAFGVPNLGGPAQPLVSRVSNALDDPVKDGVRLRVKVPHGASPPVAWRLRRTSTPVGDPLRMPVVLEGQVPKLDDEAPFDPEGRTFEIALPGPLKPWVNYRFVVEVQADSPPGTHEVAGDWGDPSAPVKVAVMPVTGPKGPLAVNVSGAAGGVQIKLQAQPLESWTSTMMGAFSFETWRLQEGTRPLRVDLPYVHDAASGTWSAFDPVPAVAGMTVAVRIVDPLGRASAPVASQVN